jgi:hypothetical protein
MTPRAAPSQRAVIEVGVSGKKTELPLSASGDPLVKSNPQFFIVNGHPQYAHRRGLVLDSESKRAKHQGLR